MGVRPSADAFGEFYYANCCGKPYLRNDEWLGVFDRIAERIERDIAPRRALDAGCAIGLLVERLRARGIDAEGIDISTYAIQQAHESVRPYCRVASLADGLTETYDLIVCIEVLEHMSPDDAGTALASMCAHTDDVLFSSSPRDFSEQTHVNVRPAEDWAELFARQGFLRDLDFDASFITPWAARFRRRSEPVPRIVREYERACARAIEERNELRNQVLQWDRHVQTEAAAAPALRADLARANDALLMAQQRIAEMEGSRSWRLRNAWVAFVAMLRGKSGKQT
jgi:SAM-dependent methyltransferase